MYKLAFTQRALKDWENVDKDMLEKMKKSDKIMVIGNTSPIFYLHRLGQTAGVILKAKQGGYIRSVRPIFESLKQLDFWISDVLMDNIIRMAGE